MSGEIVGHHHRWRSYKLISTNLTGLHVAILRLLFLDLRYTLIDSPKMMGKVSLKSTGHSSNSTASFVTIMLEAPIPGRSVSRDPNNNLEGRIRSSIRLGLNFETNNVVTHVLVFEC